MQVFIMIKKHYTDVTEEEVTKANSTKTTIRWLITDKDGSQRFSTRRFEIQPGGQIGVHDHVQDHHVYILEGEGQFIGGKGKTFPAKKGDTIYIPPNSPHGILNNGSEALIFICVIPYL
jgi:quercetin dioxygenase-like cupin family protein